MLTTRGKKLYLGDQKIVENLLNEEVVKYREKLAWRAEYDVVMSLTAWVASCSLSDAGGTTSFCAALHPAIDVRELRQKPADWWIKFVEKHFLKCVSVSLSSRRWMALFQMTEMVRENANSASYLMDRMTRRPSRWSLTSAGASDNEDLLELRICKPLGEKDEAVEAYFESIGGRHVLDDRSVIDAT